MTKALVMTQIRLRQLLTNREGGQGTLEYIGMILVAALLVVGIAGVASGVDLKSKFSDAVNTILGK